MLRRLVILCCLFGLSGCALLPKPPTTEQVIEEITETLKEVYLERWHYDADTVHPDQ